MPFLDRLPFATRQLIENSGRVIKFGPDDELFGEGAPWVGIVTEGLIRTCSLEVDGCTVVRCTVTPGGLLGVSVLLGVWDRMAARSIGHSVVLRLDPTLVTRLRHHNPPFIMAVAGDLHDRLAEAERAVQSMGIGPVRRRLALQLLETVTRSIYSDAWIVPATHEALASALATSREVVSRNLEAMAARGIVRQLGRGRLQILDLEQLHAYSHDAGLPQTT